MMWNTAAFLANKGVKRVEFFCAIPVFLHRVWQLVPVCAKSVYVLNGDKSINCAKATKQAGVNLVQAQQKSPGDEEDNWVWSPTTALLGLGNACNYGVVASHQSPLYPAGPAV